MPLPDAARKWWADLSKWKKSAYPVALTVVIVGLAVGLYFPIQSIVSKDEVHRTWTERECEVTEQECVFVKCSSLNKGCSCRTGIYQEYGYSLSPNCKWLAEQEPEEAEWWSTPGASSPECIGDYEISYAFVSPTDSNKIERKGVGCGAGSGEHHSSLCPPNLGTLCIETVLNDPHCRPEQLSQVGQRIPCWINPKTGDISIEGSRDVGDAVAGVVVVSVLCCVGILVGGFIFYQNLKKIQTQTVSANADV